MARTSDSLLLVDILLNAGANINALDAKGLTPLNYALQSGHLAIAETLVVDPRMQTIIEPSSRNALVDACGLSTASGQQADARSSVDRALLTVDHDLLVLLLEKSLMVDPHLESLNKSSPFKSDIQALDKPNVNVDSRLYWSALCAATNSGNLDAMALLLSEPDININLQDGPWRETALHIACRKGDLGAVQLLKDAGEDGLAYALRNALGETPLYLAVEGNNVEISALLLDRSDVKHALYEEINNNQDSGWKPSTLECVEDLNIKGVMNDILLHMIIEVVGNETPPSAHLHSCFAHNMSYREFLTLGNNNSSSNNIINSVSSSNSSKPPLHPGNRVSPTTELLSAD